jgi:formylglycine-generating enzyme required for sulfatase activity
MIYRSWQAVEYAVRTGEPNAEMLRKAYVDRLLGPYQDEVQTAILSKTRDRDLPLERRPSHIMSEFLAVRTGPKKFRFGFRRIPPDESCSLEFIMGSPPDEPGHEFIEGPLETAIEHPFELACTPTTNQQYELFDPWHREMGWNGLGNRLRPVVNVSWYDAWAFCLWLGDRFGLPSEKQWEYACRSGQQTRFCFGNDERRLGDYARIDEDHTYPVGRLKQSPWGLLDIHGNVFEWCANWFFIYEYENPDGLHCPSSRMLCPSCSGDGCQNDLRSIVNPCPAMCRSSRSGSYGCGAPEENRCACREWDLPTCWDDNTGFRVARALRGNLNSYFPSLREECHGRDFVSEVPQPDLDKG